MDELREDSGSSHGGRTGEVGLARWLESEGHLDAFIGAVLVQVLCTRDPATCPVQARWRGSVVSADHPSRHDCSGVLIA